MPETKNQTVEQKVLRILEEQFGGEGEITLDTRLVNDLGADSLDAVEIVEYLEDEFDIKIPEKDVGGLVSPKALVDYIRKRMQDTKYED